MLKKIIGMTLALVMVLSMVQLPASAAVTNIFSATIEGRDSSYASALKTNYSASANFYLDAGITGTGYISRNQSVTSITEIERSAGKTALEFVTNSSGDTIKVFGENTPYTVQTNDVLHFSIDFKTADMNCDKHIVMRDQDGTQDTLLTFTADGYIKLAGAQLVGAYSVDTWYDIDLYSKTSSRHIYLFINGEPVVRLYKNFTEIKISYLGAQWTAPTDKTTTVDIDDIVINTMTNDDLAAKLPTWITFFDSLDVGTDIDKLANDANTSKKPAISKNANTTVEIYQRTPYNRAVKFVYTDGSSAEYIHGEANQTVNSGDIFHFGVDLKFEDMINDKSVILRAGASSTYDNWNFIKFKTDGTIRVWDKVVALWDTNTWYEIDVYHDTANNLWCVYINDEFCACVAKNLTYNGNLVSLVRISWAVANMPAGTSTHIDNFTYGVVSPAYLNDLLPQVPADNTLSAVRNTVDANSILINAAGPEMTGTLIAALYNGEELAEVKTVDAAYASYVTFTKAGDNAKIMWWNGTEGDITPKVVAVPVSFAAAN